MGTISARLATSPTPARPRLQLIPGGAGEAASRSPGEGYGERGWRGPVSAAPPGRPAGRTLLPSARGVSPVGGGGRPVGVAALPAAGAPGLRLTRRGRFVVRAGAAVLAVIGVLVLALLLTRPAAAGGERHELPVQYHVVLPGETLWSIAGELVPQGDRREVIAEIVELNALPGPDLAAGQRIALPAAP